MRPDSHRLKLTIPPIAVGASKVMMDLFNAADSGISLYIRGATLIPNKDTAISGVVGVRYSLTRTSSLGTGGTAAVYNGTDPTVPTLTHVDAVGVSLPAGITARSAPSGGAAAGAVIATRQVFTEETAANNVDTSYIAPYDPEQLCIVPPGTGLRIVQGTVAGLGSVGMELLVGVKKA